MVAGVQGCTYGCLGFGDCERACGFDAIHTVNGLARIDYEKCTGCGACEKACPRGIISMVPFKAERVAVIACANHDPGKLVRSICKLGCIGCNICAKLNDLFNVSDGLAGIDYDRYDGEMDFGPAVEKCPRKRIVFVGKPSKKDLAATADEALSEPVQAQAESTVDRAPRRG